MDMQTLIDTNILTYMRKNAAGANVVGTNYSTGTVSIAATTGVVTGTGTTFTAAMVGGYLKATGHTSWYLVTAYTSATSITIKDLDGVSYTGGVITGATYVINAATALAITKSNVYQYLVQLGVVLGQSLASKTGRFLVINSQMEGIFRQAPEFIPAVGRAYDEVVRGASIGHIAGFEIYVSELVDGDNTTGYWFVAGTRDWVSMAMQIMKTSMVSSESDPNSFVTTCKGLLVWGRKAFEGTRSRGAVLRATLS